MIRTKDIKQTVIIKATPQEVYEALMDSKKHSAFTDAPAKISSTIGGKFTAYGGYIHGENKELVPGKKIVQLWSGSDWPKEHFSIATFDLQEIPTGTKLLFEQTGIPEKEVEHIATGWEIHYWKPMKAWLEK